jgi:AcrR family transcriptional regulator
MTRDLIAGTARRLFLEHGFDAVTVAQIAREAGVAEKTVFNHFPTKEDLFYSRMESFEEELLTALRERPGGEPLLDAFVRFVTTPRGMLASAAPDAGDQLYAISRVIADSPALLAREQHVYDRYTDTLAGLIEDETGGRSGDIDSWVVANALIGIHRALIEYVRRAVLAGERDPKRLRRAIRAEAKNAAARLEQGLG